MKKYKKIYIEITNNCNLHCSFCSPVTRPRKNMSLDEFKSILEKIHTYTDYIYLHVKGEPLLHPQIIECIKEAEKYHLKVNLTTNGTLFPKIAKELGTCKNLNKINFSLHSENEKENYLEDIFENIKYLSPKTTVIYRLWTLKDKRLDEKSTKIVDKIKNYYHLSTETVDKIKRENNVKIAPSIYIDKENEFEWPKESSYKSKGYCYALKTQIAILVDGTVVPCCLDSDGKVPLGNIFEEELEEIRKKPIYESLQKSFQDRNPIAKLCQSCTFKERL